MPNKIASKKVNHASIRGGKTTNATRMQKRGSKCAEGSFLCKPNCEKAQSTKSTNSRKGRLCNSEKEPPSSNIRNRIYAFTINNYTEEIIADIYSFFKKSTKSTSKNTLLGGLFTREVGESGTPHLQGALKFEQPLLFTSIRKFCPAFEKAHMEPARKEWIANVKYCLKSIKFGHIENILYCDEYNETIMKCLCGIFVDHKDYIISLYSECIKYFDFVNGTSNKKKELEKKKSEDEELAENNRLFLDNLLGSTKPLNNSKILASSLKNWQLEVIKIYKQTPDERSIHWFYDKFGGAGKSTLAKFFYQNYKDDGIAFVCGKSADIKCNIMDLLEVNNKLRLIIFDIPRTSEGYVNYQAIEELKNGLIFSTKYVPRSANYSPPHIFIFANFLPNLNVMTLSRWKIYNISMDIYSHGYELDDPIESDDIEGCTGYDDINFFNFKNDTYTKSQKKLLAEALEKSNAPNEPKKRNTEDELEKSNAPNEPKKRNTEDELEKSNAPNEPKKRKCNDNFFDVIDHFPEEDLKINYNGIFKRN
jgi:hypothetical protein